MDIRRFAHPRCGHWCVLLAGAMLCSTLAAFPDALASGTQVVPPQPARQPIPAGRQLEPYVFAGVIGGPGAGDGRFDYPYDVTVLAQRLYVADSHHNRVQVFDLAGHYLFQWGQTGYGDGQFRRNRGIAATPPGVLPAAIFVTDAKNDRIQKFDADGQHLATWGSIGQGAEQFFRPRGIDVAPDGSIAIGDADNHRMKVYRADLSLRAIFGARGVNPGEFTGPFDCAVGPDGLVHVADLFNHRIQTFTLDGVFVAAFGDSGTGPGQLWDPRCVAVDQAGALFVGEVGNNRVQKFLPDGTLLAVFGGHGSGPGQLNFPVGLAVDAQGRVYVADSHNHRIAIWARPTVAAKARSIGSLKRRFGD